MTLREIFEEIENEEVVLEVKVTQYQGEKTEPQDNEEIKIINNSVEKLKGNENFELVANDEKQNLINKIEVYELDDEISKKVINTIKQNNPYYNIDDEKYDDLKMQLDEAKYVRKIVKFDSYNKKDGKFQFKEFFKLLDSEKNELPSCGYKRLCKKEWFNNKGTSKNMSIEQRVEYLKKKGLNIFKDLKTLEKINIPGGGTSYILINNEGKKYGGESKKWGFLSRGFVGTGEITSQEKEAFQEKDIEVKVNMVNKKSQNKEEVKVTSYKLGEKAVNRETGKEENKKNLPDEEKKNYTNSSDIGFNIDSVGIRAELKNYENNKLSSTNGIDRIIDLIDAGDKNKNLKTFGIFFKSDGITYEENSSGIGKKIKNIYKPQEITQYISNKCYRITDDKRFVDEVMTPLCNYCYFVFENFGKTKEIKDIDDYKEAIDIDNLIKEGLIKNINNKLKYKNAEKLFNEIKRAYAIMKQNRMISYKLENYINKVENSKNKYSLYKANFNNQQQKLAASTKTKYFNY